MYGNLDASAPAAGGPSLTNPAARIIVHASLGVAAWPESIPRLPDPDHTGGGKRLKTKWSQPLVHRNQRLFY